MAHPPLARRLTPALLIVGVLASPASAAPRDEALRLAPPDAALVFLLQNARDHARNLAASPFAEWFPQSALGKHLPAGVDGKQLREAAGPLFAALGITPDEFLNDVIGDAVVFAYTPGPVDDPAGERAVLLVRPRKPDVLAKLVERVNELQTGSGEVKEVVRRKHGGAEYAARQKPGGGADYYCFRGGVFAFSGSEADIRAVIDRDRATASGTPPELAGKFTKLGVGDAAAVVLINPRAFDAAVTAKIAAVKAAERPVLARFREVWLALDSAAVSAALGADLELGVSLQFQPGKLPAATQRWLTGPRARPEIWGAIPDTALFAVAGRVRASDLIEAIGSLAADDGKNPLKSAAEQMLGPVFGRDRLPQVLDALGPNWAVWAEPPPQGAFLPVGIAAVQLDASGPNGKVAARAVVRAVSFGFDTARIGYNANHADQIELQEAVDGDATITTLVNDTGFPAGFRPSFALKGGYLVVSTSPDAIRRFRTPAPGAGDSLVARVSGPAVRAYLQAHGAELGKFLAAAGHGDEAVTRKQFEKLAAVLEPVERVEFVSRGGENGLRLGLRVKFVKPLK